MSMLCCKNITDKKNCPIKYTGVDPGEVKWVNFHPPLFLSPLLSFFSYPSNIEKIFDDVNKIDRSNTTPTVRAICTFAVYFSVFQPF